MTLPPEYTMYVDECGNADLKSSGNPNHRFLSLTGLILKRKDVVRVLLPALDDLKSEIFGAHPDDEVPIVLHRRDLLDRKRPPFDVLASDPVKSAEFDRRLLHLINTLDYTLVTVVIDKLEHVKKYVVMQHEPYHYCMQVLLERYVLFLKRNGSTGDVLAESRNGKEDKLLGEVYTKFHASGSDFVSYKFAQTHLTTGQLKLKKKLHNIAGLQLCDILAYPSRRILLVSRGLDVIPGPGTFSDFVMRAIQDRHDSHRGTVYGLKMLP